MARKRTTTEHNILHQTDDVAVMRGKGKPSWNSKAEPAVYKHRGQSMGIKFGNTRSLIRRVKKGLPYKTLTTLEGESGISAINIAQIVGLPPRTLARRKAERRLGPGESERLIRLGLVYEKTLDLFEGDRIAAYRWLNSPTNALGDQTPLEMVQTEIGAREVEDLIGRLEYGVFS